MGKFLQTVAAMACLKSLLMVFNMAFWVSTKIPIIFIKHIVEYSAYKKIALTHRKVIVLMIQ